MGSAPTIGGVFLGQATPLNFDMADNVNPAFRIGEGANDYLVASTLNANESLFFGQAGTFPLNYVFNVKDNGQPFNITNSAGTLNYYNLITANGSESHNWNGDGPGASYAYRLADNRADALVIAEGAAGVNEYYRLRTTNAGERQDWSLCEFVFNLKDDLASALRLTEAGNIFLEVKTSNGAEGLKLGLAAGTVGFFGSFGTAKPTVAGSRALPEQGLKNFLAALAAMGLFVDNTTV